MPTTLRIVLGVLLVLIGATLVAIAVLGGRARLPRNRFAGVRTRSSLDSGPAFVAAVAYVDPGNVATNTTAGATYRYLLLWVLVAATLMAGASGIVSSRIAESP